MNNHLKIIADDVLPLRDVVFKTLRQAILMGELSPGERLMEIKLADQLGVSRTPIREAMRKLELEGLVIMIPRKGAQVANMSKKDLDDVLEVRLALEDLAIELACERITLEELTRLNQALFEFKQAVEGKNLSVIAEKDVLFHDLIYSSTKNIKLIQLLNNLSEQLYRYRLEYLKDYSLHRSLVKEHKDIVDTLRSRDLEKAKETIQMHIKNQAYAVSAIITREEDQRIKL